MRTTRWTAVTAALLLTTALGSAARADETGYGGAATNANSIDDGGLTALTVGGMARQWTHTIAGTSAATPNQVYAQPLSITGLGSTYPNGLVVVATEENEVEALDPTTGAVKWARNLGPSWTPTPTCGDLLPHIGVTSTPTYDPATHTLYVVAKADDGPDVNHPSIKVHALDVLHGGVELPHWPLTVAGRSTNGGQTFDAATSAQRPALLLSHGALYVGFASHCDHGPFDGFVGRVGNLAGTPTLSLWTTEENDPNGQGGIWQSGGGIASDGVDANGRPRLFIATGNGLGTPPPKGPGTSPPGDLANSVVRLGVNSDGSMQALDFFSPTNNRALDLNDADLGSGAPVVLPDSYGSGTHPHLLTVTGKDGIVRLLDRDDLGGVGQGAGGTDDVVDSVHLSSGVWGHATVFDGGTGRHFVYIIPANGSLTALTVAPDAGGNPTLSTTATSPQTFGFGSGSPVVTSDDGDPTTALVWVVKVDGPTGSGAQLLAYPAVPTGGSWQPVATFPLPTMAKFVQPATDGGQVFVGTRNGQVLAFGAATPAVTAPPTDFGGVAVGSTSTRTVTLTATTALNGLTVSATGPFDAGTPSRTSVPAGGTVTVPVTFAPTSTGLGAGRLVVTSGATSAQVSVRGTGVRTGLVSSPGTLAIGRVAVGQSAGNGVQLINTGATPIVFSGAATLSGPSSLRLTGTTPRAGTTIAPGGALTVRVTFSPTAAGEVDGTLTLTAGSQTLSAPVTAEGYTGTPYLYLTATSIDFGNVAPGGSAGASFQTQNIGDAAMTITKAAPPAAPFAVTYPIAEGSVVQPGGQATALYTQIFAQPTTAMPRTDVYTITADHSADGVTRKFVHVSVNTHPWSGPVVGRFGCVTFRSLHAGTPAVVAGCSGSGATFTRTTGAYYRLGGATSHACLAVRGGATAPGSAVELAVCSAKARGQTWIAGAGGTMIDLHSRLCLRLRNGATAAGTPLVLDRCTTSTTEQWDVSALVPNRGALSSGLGTLGQYCLTDRGGQRRTGTAIELAGCALSGAGATSQVIAHLGSTLRVLGGCLAVSAGRVVLGYCNGGSVQAWQADPAGRLVNGATRQCLAVPGDATTSGTQLTVARCSSARGQRWTLPDAPTAR